MSRGGGKVKVMVCPEPKVAPSERLKRVEAKRDFSRQWDFPDLPFQSYGFQGGGSYWSPVGGDADGLIWPIALGGEA